MTTMDHETTLTSTRPTPIGPLTMAATEVGLVSCTFESAERVAARLARHGVTGTDSVAAGEWLALAGRELDEYFAGQRQVFTVPVDLRLANEFDRTVLAGLDQVGYGETVSYGRLGARLGLPREAVRGVGQAMALNPVLVVVPCHRVVGADGSLTGYAGGLPAKRHLLDLEADQLTLV